MVYELLFLLSYFGRGSKKPMRPHQYLVRGFKQYVDKTLMAECRKAPVDATLRADGEKLVSVAAQPGGQCERADVVATLRKSTGQNLTSQLKVKVAQKAIAPAVGDNVPEQLADEISERIKAGIPLQVSGATVQVPAKDVVTWLDFADKDGAIAVAVNADK